MNTKQVRVVVDRDGKVSVEWGGYQGPACLAAADKLREVLAARYGIKTVVEQIEAKPELEAALEAGEVTLKKTEEQHNG